eukprot:761537-Hanusia_phi.AAC.7
MRSPTTTANSNFLVNLPLPSKLPRPRPGPGPPARGPPPTSPAREAAAESYRIISEFGTL